jgi:hypothetical protein
MGRDPCRFGLGVRTVLMVICQCKLNQLQYYHRTIERALEDSRLLQISEIKSIFLVAPHKQRRFFTGQRQQYHVLPAGKTKFFYLIAQCEDGDFERERAFDLLLLSSEKLSLLGSRMHFPVMGYIGSGYRYVSADGSLGRFISQIRQNLLVAKIGGFLEHQIFLLEETGFYLQDDQPEVLVLVLNPESVLGISYLRNYSKVPELACQIFSHVIVPFFGNRMLLFRSSSRCPWQFIGKLDSPVKR